MIIRKVSNDGTIGPDILRAATLRLVSGDTYSVTVESIGLDRKGDQSAMRLSLSKNEIAELTRWAERF